MLSASAHEVRRITLDAFHSLELAALAARRKPFEPCADGIDEYATLRMVRSKDWTELKKATLRTVMVGGAVPQAVAAKWSPDGPKCPHCPMGNEDSFHRFWVCPRWGKARLRALGDVSVPWLRHRLPAIALSHGLLPLARVANPDVDDDPTPTVDILRVRVQVRAYVARVVALLEQEVATDVWKRNLPSAKVG